MYLKKCFHSCHTLPIVKMELLIYFLKLKIKLSKEIKILKVIPDFWTMFLAQETCYRSRKVSGAGSRTGLLNGAGWIQGGGGGEGGIAKHPKVPRSGARSIAVNKREAVRNWWNTRLCGGIGSALNHVGIWTVGYFKLWNRARIIHTYFQKFKWKMRCIKWGKYFVYVFGYHC